MFSGCQSLSDVKFPNGLKTISGDYNFANTAIEQAIFPDSLIEITGVCNFASCEKLTNVLLPEKLPGPWRWKFLGLCIFGGSELTGDVNRAGRQCV